MAKSRGGGTGKRQQEQRLRKPESCFSSDNVKHRHSDELYRNDTEMREDRSRENEDDCLMQTSCGYDYDLHYELDTHKHSWENNKQAREEESDILKKTKLTERRDQEDKPTDTKTQTREERIESLKALLRKHEEAIEKLRPDAKKDKQKKCFTIAKNRKNNASRSNPSTEAVDHPSKRKSRRRKTKKAEPCTSRVVNTREVDILMSKGDLITKDEFLAVIGLVRVAKLHSV